MYVLIDASNELNPITVMSYQENQNRLEHRRLLKLAREYREKGYCVTIYPSSDKLPPVLADCSLDLIAVNGSNVVAAEVRSRENLNLNGSQDLCRISQSVQQLPGWEFELVITNARKKSE
jgi:Holliday junction resolvase